MKDGSSGCYGLCGQGVDSKMGPCDDGTSAGCCKKTTLLVQVDGVEYSACDCTGAPMCDATSPTSTTPAQTTTTPVPAVGFCSAPFQPDLLYGVQAYQDDRTYNTYKGQALSLPEYVCCDNHDYAESRGFLDWVRWRMLAPYRQLPRCLF